jgi:hypothetical protein
MMAFLKVVGLLILLFFICYFVAALANQNAYQRGKPTDNLGCAVILFVLAMLCIIAALFGRL